ncbi:MAG: ATP-binding protein [Pseudomonadota bacterium]
MSFDPVVVLLAAGCYLLLFFGVAWLTEQGRMPARLLQHPGLYVLSLGIIVSTWSFYTAYLSASSRGMGYNAYYIGFAGAFILSPLLLQPLLRITQRFQLASLADLFAFRFRSPWAGTLTTIVLLLCALPLQALQTLTVATSAQLLAPALDPQLVAFMFTLVIVVFALRFGTPDVTGREPNSSLVVSLAFEGLLKLFILLITGGFALYGVFNGFDSLDNWLAVQPPAVDHLEIAFSVDSTTLRILMFFTAAIAMPHVFHMIFPENRNPRNLQTASWALPLYLLFASVPVLPILWAYYSQGQSGNLQYAPLLMIKAANAPLLSLLYFVGGLAAACGLTIVLSLSVANMCMNHLLLRTIKPPAGTGLYAWLMLRRRLLITGLLICGYLSYLLIADGRWLQDTAYISFSACLQFLPGLLALLYWPPANSKGFLSGLAGGFLVWFLLGLLPYLSLTADLPYPLTAANDIDWDVVAGGSLLANLCLLLIVSAFTKATEEERKAARLCAPDTGPAVRHVLRARSITDFISSLSAPMGADAAGREVAQALRDLHLHSDEKRPYQLLQLRNQLEANLSALLGPTLSHELVEHYLPLVPATSASAAGVLNLLEQGVESWQGNLSGVALDLDLLRRHHRQVLQNLPLGVCELDDKGRVALWNAAMSKLTGLPGEQIIGQLLSALPRPWQQLLQDFANDPHVTRLARQPLAVEGKPRWFELHKALLTPTTATNRAGKTTTSPGQVILLEDQTETMLMEKELAHADRLNSIGRLAAGVAHEIGNPVTGIACLAQNLRDESVDPELQAVAEKMLAQTRRIAGITDALLRFSHAGTLQEKPTRLEAVELHKVAAEAISLFILEHDAVPIVLTNGCQPGLFIKADYQQILQVLLNLLGNARDASVAGGRVTISTHGENDLTSLHVSDEGCGIPASLIPRVFEPFFTTKDPGKGTGLGLALVYRLVTDLGGHVQIHSHTMDSGVMVGKKGTRVIVTFPCYDPGTLVTESGRQVL